MYHLIIYIYQLGVMVMSLFSEKVRKMWRGEREAFGVLREKVDPTARYAWFHAASLGEFEQGRPIIERLRREHPEYKILLTFFSPSGYEVRKNYEGADIICYLPLDTVTNARRFLRLVRPSVAFFIKYEFWYNYLHILKHRGIPTYSVSSIFRPGQVFFRWYGRQYGRVLKCFTHFFVQNEVSRKLLSGIGITNVTVTGDTRFDRVLQIKSQAKQLPIVEAFLSSPAVPTLSPAPLVRDGSAVASASPASPSSSPAPLVRDGSAVASASSPQRVFVAGSSWGPDEEIFMPFFNKVLPEWKLIIAPHVIGEDHLSAICQLAAGRKVVRYLQVNQTGEALSPQTVAQLREADILIIDCFGLLSSIYRYADVAYVGGGFGVGIHNLPEAAVWDVPVFFGPNNQRFQEAQDLKANGGGIQIDDSEDFDREMRHLATHPADVQTRGQVAGEYVKGRAGATEAILSAVSLS